MNLFDEVSFGGVTLKNRLVMAPMGVSHAEDDGIDEKMRHI